MFMAPAQVWPSSITVTERASFLCRSARRPRA
jgi:hypothetical protein